MKTHQPMPECDHQRAIAFLKSDHYRLEDTGLIKHLETCAECRAYMDSEAAEPQVWQKLKHHLPPTEFDQAGTVDYSAATCIGHADQQPASMQEVLDSLTPTDDPDKLGRLGTYEITGVVGVGGMGVVLKAVDPSLDRVVAVKVMAPSLANNEKARKRFAREAKAAAAVLHPNVVPIHSVSSDAALPYLVMAYIRGGSLQKRIENGRPLPVVEILRIGSQIAAGLAAAHEQGLIHRDIKPENILLEEGVERVTITDFGLARAVDDNTVTQLGVIAGTPQYMSPEQARGEQLDQSSDLFSLGSVLYTLCTGHPPYTADSSFGVMRKIIDESPTPIGEINSDIPNWLVAIVDRLMASDKAQRYSSATELHRLLDAVLSHVQQPQTFPLPAELSNINRNRSNRKTHMKIFISVLAVGLSIGGFFTFRDQIINQMNETAYHQEIKVVRPLSQLDSLLIAMMNSPHDPDTVYLNLGDIGKDKLGLSFKKIDGGMSWRMSLSNAMFGSQKGPYVKRLREVAESLSIAIEEKSDLANDGNVKGVNFKMHLTGEPSTVAATILDVVKQTFQVDDSEQCRFLVRNMPSGYFVRDGEAPKKVTAAEFLAEAQSGNRVYLGEQQNLVFLVPKQFDGSKKLQWNEQLWSTDVRELSFDDLNAIRNGTVTNSIVVKNPGTATETSDEE